MAPDGQIGLTVGALSGTQRYNLEFQALPWLDASFRYSAISKFRHISTYYDRSFGLKIRLTEESENLPEVSLGLRDMLGTGIYSGEYIVASKRYSDFDMTLGAGWGRFAQSNALPNPLAQLFSSFKTRGDSATNGGTVNFGQLFHGPKIGIFGGAVWHTPIENLDALVEYSSDRYSSEQEFGSFKERSPVNVGLAYHAFDLLTVSAGWFYGSSYGLTFSLSGDPTIPTSPQKFGPQIPAPVIRSPKEETDALSLLLRRAEPVVANATPGALTPWVQVPQPPADPQVFAMEATFMSVAPNIRDVDVMGRTLVINAHMTQVAQRQCDGYAHIAAAIDPKVETIALSDMDDRSGRVEICKIAGRTDAPVLADAAPGDAPPEPASDGIVGDTVDTARKNIQAGVAAQSLNLEALSVEPTTVYVYFSNTHYATDTEAAGRVARVLMSAAPPTVEIFHILVVRDGLVLRDFRISRSALERAVVNHGSPVEMGGALTAMSAPLSNPVLEEAFTDSYPRYHWDISPGLREGFFDPNRPLQVQVYAAANASLDLTPKLSLQVRGEANILNNYDLNQTSNSQLPHVRTDVVQYLRDGINGIAILQGVYHTRLSREFYVEAKAGYLEDMFAGGGLQALWRPDGERFSFGADLYDVWQRNFDRLFGFRNYHILTGHASVYYQSPWYGLNFAVHAGRYLAGDYGATVEMTRRFSTGVEIGAFATFTNVPFSKFGEGSFDKGVIIHIPLEWALPFYSHSSYDLLLRSLTRDGGQRLDDDDSLYGETAPDSYGETVEHLDEITAP